MKIKSKKILSVLLAVVITISAIPVSLITTSAATTYVFPVCGVRRVNSKYGYRTFNGVTTFHGGIDIPGTDCSVVATLPGTVSYVSNNCWHNNNLVKCEHWLDYGNVVKIKHADGTESVYGHVKHNSITVKVGDTVKAGQKIAVVGSSGYSSGPHLHFEIRNSDKTKRNVNIGVINYKYIDYPELVETKPPKPGVPNISITKIDIAQGASAEIKWNLVSNAKTYYLKVVGNSVNETFEVGNTNKYSYTLSNVGTYSFSVCAKGDGGESSYSSTVSCTAHEPSTVTFLDWDGSELEKVEVKYGEDAKAPEIPKREGYTFSSWDSSYYNITSDKIINAVYKINTYTVNFIGADGEILKTEKVKYGESATPPSDTKPKDGYVFYAWENEEYKNVYVENGTTLNVNAIYNWENPDIPIVCSNATATRKDEDKGYYVYFDLKNYPNAITRGRAVVSLKTADDKLVDMSESAAFSIPAGGTKTGIEVFIPSDKAATSVEIVIVDSYSSGVPISEKVTAVVTNEDMWSDWTDTKPEDYDKGYADVEDRTVYKYRAKETTTGNTKTLDGWTWDGTRIEIKGVWSAWGWDEKKAEEYEGYKIEVETQANVFHYYNKTKPQYNYYRYSVNRQGGYSSPSWTKDHPTLYDDYVFDSPLDETSSGSGKYKWWYNSNYYCILYAENPYITYVENPSDPHYDTQYRTRKITYKYNFWKWGEFSEWSTTPVTETADIDVVPKTQYRYYSNAITVEDNSGVERTISSAKYGTLPAFAGKQLSLFVYKVDGASDYTNEYIGQTEIGENGEYSFTFKLREEPTVKTGDYTVAIGIEGTTDLIVIDTIEAPKAEYTVKFYNWEGNVISTQTIKEGNNALLPENPVKEGYVFKGWDTSVANISQDLEIHPVFEKETYSIVFVDWTKQSVIVEEYSYGDIITPPENSVIEGHDFGGWDMLNDGNVTATKDMVITAVYDKKHYNVNFYDFEGNVISTQSVAYGESAETPSLGEGENGEQFAGWNNAEDFMDVTHDVAVYPVYYFKETTDVPVANYESGEYPDAIELTLTSPDENAVIYYYLNGDVETTQQYTGPVTIDTTCSVTYYAQSLGKNDSEYDIRYYCINNAGEFTNWMLYSEIPVEVKNNIADYNLESEDGYRYKDVVITSSVDEQASLTKSGWTASGDVTTIYSDWQDEELAVDTSLIDCVVETQSVADSSITNYQYSHYKYTDENGTVCYSPTEVSGYECTYETIQLSSRLSIAGFLDDGTSYYTYNDGTWFKQTKVTGTKTQYRLVYSEIEYYKWTPWGIDAPTSSETREYENETVYRYTNKNYHIVNVVGINEIMATYLVQSGETLDMSEISDVYGYDFEGLYLDAECTQAWDYTQSVTASVDVYANYTPKQYIVTFQMKDGTEIDVQTVNYMEPATAPETDVVPGWVFAGWDKDFDCITEDTVVTGKYVKESEYARISLNKSRAFMYVGNRITLIPAITPANLSGEAIQWASSDPTVASVDDKGNVVALSAGETIISVTVLSTKETATCRITVTGNSETDIMLKDNASAGLDEDGNVRITPIASDKAYTVADIKAQFENEGLVFADSDGTILNDEDAVGTGTTISLVYAEVEVDSVKVVLTGDFNGDGYVDNKDVVMINQYVLEKRTANSYQMIAIDVNADGYVNNRDCAMLSQYLVDKVTL